MKNEYLHTPYTQSIMAGLFAGLIATVVSLIYNLVFRGATNFGLSSFINVSSIIFSIPLLLLPAGFIYHALSRYKARNFIFTIAFAVLTLLCIWLNAGFQRSADPLLSTEFRHLLLGIIIITGFCSFFIPYLATHETNII